MKKFILAFSVVSSALFLLLWLTFAPSYVINSGLTTQRKILENNQQFILYSLDPSSRYSVSTIATETRKSVKEKFHNYDVLGKTRITNPAIKAKLVEALESGIDEGGSAGMMCFDPRHGIRAVRGDQTVDLVICFECQKISVYTNRSSGTAYTSSSPRKDFNDVLVDAKIPLPKNPLDQ